MIAPQVPGNLLPQVVPNGITLNQLRAYLAQVPTIYANGIANGEDVAWMQESGLLHSTHVQQLAQQAQQGP